MGKWQKNFRQPKRIGVLLFERFSNHCLANAVEPMRAVNELLGRQAYDWRYLSVDGAPVTSSSGLPVTVQASLGRDSAGDVLMLLPGYGYAHMERRMCCGRYGRRRHGFRLSPVWIWAVG